MALTHSKVSAKTDSGDTGLIRPSDWNADHVGGALSTPALYVIYKEGSTYYANACFSGGTDYSGSDAATVINSALGGLTAGRTWKEKIVIKGNFEINSTILLPSYTILEVQGQIKQANTTNLAVLIANQYWLTGTNTDIEVFGGIYDSNWDGQTTYVKGDAFEGACFAFYGVTSLAVDNIKGKNFGQYGVLTIGNCQNVSIGSIYGENGIGRDGYSGVLFLTAVSLSNVMVNSVYGKNILGPGLYLEDLAHQVNIGKVQVIQSEINFISKGGGVSAAMAYDVNIDSIYSYQTGRTFSFDGFNNVLSRNFNIGQIIALKNGVEGINIKSSGASTLHNVDIAIGRIITKNNGQLAVQHGFHIEPYVAGVYVNTLISGDNQTPKTQSWGVVLEGPLDAIEILGGDLRGNAAGPFYSGGVLTNVSLKNLIGYTTENSGTSTGTGEHQTIAHDLVATPTVINLFDIEIGANAIQVTAADATNIYVRAAEGKDYGWEAAV